MTVKASKGPGGQNAVYMVVLSAGFKPNVELAAEAGVEVGPHRRHPHR